ncbi:CHAT domain-containing protein [Sulfitobacter mediterraneus]|nr:CHAT domain-containing protein [Sulfitobacter mediterraneus]MBM1641602.1 CHAT domain-containing protein [Sulfitobacter mediterraneus]MBM1673998.1 CHAT domain-containing protein [Sulfitobacter mediterraneus]
MVDLEGDTLILQGEVASEDCKGDAKRLLLGFDSVLKVRNELVVAGFLEAASDGYDDYFEIIETLPDQASPNSDEVFTAPSPDHSNSNQTEPRKSPETVETTQVHPEQLSSGVTSSLDAVEVLRCPKIETRGELSPGKEVRIEIDLKADLCLDTPAMSLGSFTPDWEAIPIRVQLFAPWATQVIAESDTVTILANGTSRPASFRLVVSNEFVIGTTAQLQVSFQHGTRVCGHMSHDLTSHAGQATRKPDNDDKIAPMIAIAAEASGPSLSIKIICNNDGSQTWMWTALVPGRIRESSGQINLANGGEEFASSLLETCPDMDSAGFRRAMAGVGQLLWETTPEHFRAAYTELRTELGGNFPIQFISDDPHIPWEMMKPDLEGVDHLFLEHPVARWPLNNAKPRRHQFPGGALLSFVPNYTAGDSPLPSAKAEGEWLCANLGAVACKATSANFLNVLDGKYGAPVGILHFAGHGSFETGIFNCGIEMEDRPIRILDVNQGTVVLGSHDATLVVLNACETSAGSRLLGMNAGWGATIAARDFGGLVAPLWEVQDDVALAIVQEVLPSLVKENCNLGEALLKARRLQSDISISAFAYLAHGDVMAKFPRS